MLLLVGGGGKSRRGRRRPDDDEGRGLHVQNVTATSRKHVTSLSAKVKYNTNPPSNGSHYFSPAIWDFYTEAGEAAAGRPQHGARRRRHLVGRQGSAATVERLRAFYNESPNGMVGTPFPRLGNKVAITAWTAPAGGMGEGHAAVCTSFDEEAFATFRDAYRGEGPERFPVEALRPGT